MTKALRESVNDQVMIAVDALDAVTSDAMDENSWQEIHEAASALGEMLDEAGDVDASTHADEVSLVAGTAMRLIEEIRGSFESLRELADRVEDEDAALAAQIRAFPDDPSGEAANTLMAAAQASVVRIMGADARNVRMVVDALAEIASLTGRGVQHIDALTARYPDDEE